MDDNEKKLRKELADLIFDGIELKDISYYEEKYPKTRCICNKICT